MFIRVKIFSSFCSSIECKIKYERLCEVNKMKNYGVDKEIYITTNNDYTHAIILNTAMPILNHIPKKNVLGLAFEPPAYLKLTKEFITYAEKYIGKYYIGDKLYWLDQSKKLPDVFIEHHSYMWHITPLNYIPVKNKLMSIMVSDKQFAPGHKYRHVLIEQILKRGLPIDIYGTGTYKYGAIANRFKLNTDSRLKGKFKELEPYENYSFHICIENFQTNAYFSEKITNTLLCGATPIYWGCKKILDYFPENVIILSGNIEKDMTLLRNIILNPRAFTARINVECVKEKINLVTNVILENNLFKRLL